MIAVFTEINTSRLAYVCRFVFENWMGEPFEFFSDVKEFNKADAYKINYSKQNIEDSLKIVPFGLLNQKTVEFIEFEQGEFKGITTFFHTGNGDMPFDIFSAVFYLISRYEEYLPHKKDNHNRYLAENSILFKNNLLETPVVDYWCQALAKLLGVETKRSYKYTSTIDVDNAYAYKFKSALIKSAGTLKSILKGDFADLKNRLSVYLLGAQDPYDTYSHIQKIHLNYKADSIFFWLLSDRNEWDKNLPHSNKHLRSIVQALQTENKMGIHPGYHSYKDGSVIQKEIFRLENITQSKVIHSRQHFLKLEFPTTFQLLADSGIEHDYSLGYAECLGFRAGTCTPFKFYNLNTEVETCLTLHTSAIMDATLNRYLNLSVEKALDLSSNIIKEVKAVKGELITIWHNETLSDIREWNKWQPVFEQVVAMAKENK